MRFNDFLNETAFVKNSKTIISVDFTTNCPKRRAGNPCPYCYVEAARNMNFNAKTVYDYEAYQGELLKEKRFKNPEFIKALNQAGGIRLFSFGDYMPEHDKDIDAFLKDAAKVGVDVKAITKQPDFIHKFHDYPALKNINVSVDFIGHGVPHEEALELKKKYPKVSIRTVILKPEDLENDFLKYVDILTFNHAKGLKKLGYKKFGKKEILQYYKDHPELGVCCITGKCSTCPIKCGKRKFSGECVMED